MNPDFSVPAEYFYALAVIQPGMSPADQLTFATSRSESQLYALFLQAVNVATIDAAPQGVTPLQAARRLAALGAARTPAPRYTVAPPAGPPATIAAVQVYGLIGASPGESWLSDQGTTLPPGSVDTDAADAAMWQALLAGTPVTANQQAQLRLVVCALTGWDDPKLGQFVTQLTVLYGVQDADGLAQLTEAQWRAFFAASPGLLPPYTRPPSQTTSASEQVELFLRYLTQFYTPLPDNGTVPAPTAPWAPPVLDRYGFDPLQAFLAAYDGANATPYTFGVSAPADAAAQAAIAAVFPGTAGERPAAWLAAALTVIGDLAAVTAGLVPAASANAAALEFSVMEALYARGFTRKAEIAELDAADFAAALTGSVAYQWAGQIWANAGGSGQPVTPPPDSFQPVNPDGTLVNCVPPPEASPLGPVAYLHEMLRAGPVSTCAQPDAAGENFGALLAARRGEVGSLHATRANLAVPLPVTDLVNECLENLAWQVVAGGGSAAAPTGAVYDTAAGQTQEELRAVPEYSSPASPVSQPDGYAALSADFSAPGLPYAQPLDVARSYLEAAGTTRFATMRRFRAKITEFALATAPDPAGFDAAVWRYPVRSDIAPEYLRIGPDEARLLYGTPIATSPPGNPGQLLLWQLYGYPEATLPGGGAWDQAVLSLSEFLPRTGLSYCEFLELWKSGVVPFWRGTDAAPWADFDPCEPCCLDEVRIVFGQNQDTGQALLRLAVFIRLWRTLRCLPGAGYSFAQLADIAAVLGLFGSGGVNPGFIAQLAAFQMLRQEFGLPLGTDSGPGQTGPGRTRLLGLWAGATAPAAHAWAVAALLSALDGYARREHDGDRDRPDLIKVLAGNLGPLSALGGFDSGNPPDAWDAAPTHTLRFTEILAKIYASPFSVGDIEFLCTAAPHLDGDDPFELQMAGDAADDPLALPGGGPAAHALWRLRQRLLDVEVDEEELAGWTWWRIDSAMRTDFGYDPAAQADPLRSLAEHSFPGVLERHGHEVPPASRRYSTPLPATSPGIWNSEPGGPFRYHDSAGDGALMTVLPLPDEAVLHTLARTRQLTDAEQAAVRELYFQPRADLAAVAFLFPDLPEADRELLQAGDEESRWAYFRRHFALARKRCQVIDEELARCAAGGADPDRDAVRRAHLVLKGLHADENLATSPWEGNQPAGSAPALTWPSPAGGAYAALLGLCGTGLLTGYAAGNGALAWQQTSGSLREFGAVRNRWNAPVPTLVPGMEPPASQGNYAEVRNGIALASSDGERLGGAAGHGVTWTGVLLVEEGGRYRFGAGAPTPEGEDPDAAVARHVGWQVTLARGQRSWVLLSHGWPGHGDTAHVTHAELRRGGYDITISFRRGALDPASPDDVHPRRTGLQVKYCGPDTGEELISLPRHRLFVKAKDAPLSDAAAQPAGTAAAAALRARYLPTLRDARRTFQRGVQGVMLVSRFCLDARPGEDGQSELGYLLSHPDHFAGTSFYRDPAQPGTFTQHWAQFDLDFLPLLDDYVPPDPAADQRAQPSPARQAALFDWWERLFDYTALRRRNQRAPRPLLWRLFATAAAANPGDPAQLLPYLDVELDHTSLAQTFDGLTALLGRPELQAQDLLDERWAARVARAAAWAREVDASCYNQGLPGSHPALWAADDPAAGLPSGNDDLTAFVRDAMTGNGNPRRLADLRRLDDGLRDRARTALLAFLCGMNRVPLPFAPAGAFATRPGQLSDLLLLDVEAGPGELATRIDDAIGAVQALVLRARLGLEPAIELGEDFRGMWDGRFASYRAWRECRRRELYPENWVAWAELERARRHEAFRFLEENLRTADLSVPVPAGIQYWADKEPSCRPCLPPLQAAEPSTLHHPVAAAAQPDAAVPAENLDLIGRPAWAGAPSWVAAAGASAGGATQIPTMPQVPAPASRGRARARARAGRGRAAGGTAAAVATGPGRDTPPGPLPLWIEAASRLGARFLRVAAAGEPAGSAVLTAPPAEAGCCAECGRTHRPGVDEYYFWLCGAEYYDLPPAQDGDLYDGAGESSWEDPAQSPSLLYWARQREVYLYWCAAGCGRFGELQRSSQGVALDPGAAAGPPGGPTLLLRGRRADSLVFGVEGGAVPASLGGTSFAWQPPYQGWTAETGWRVDLASQDAVLLPLVATPPADQLQPGALNPVLFGGLAAYPFFAYDAPGASLVPLSPFAPAIAVAGALRAHCRFEAALCWYGRYHDAGRGDNRWCHCAETVTPPPAPALSAPALSAPALSAPAQSATAQAPRPAVVAPPPPAGGPCCCEQEPPTPPAVRRRAIVLDTLETLLHWGDAVLDRDHGAGQGGSDPEAFRQARVIFDAAARILGATPATVQLADPPPPAQTVAGFVPLPAPLNPRLMSLYDRVADRLRLVREGDRARRRYGQDARSPYRFSFLIQRAFELASEVQSFGAGLLAALEKGDAEHLALLRAAQEQQVLRLGRTAREDQYRDADWQVQALEQAKLSAQNQLAYYTGLVNGGLNTGESVYQDLMGISIPLEVGGEVMEMIAEHGSVIPDSYVGTISFTKIPMTGSSFTNFFTSAAKASSYGAQDAQAGAGLANTEGSWDRRTAEWRHQIDIYGIEIEQIERQILGAERRADAALHDLNSQQREIENAAEVAAFLRGKFTSQALYLAYQQRCAGLYRELYELAAHTARRAEHAYNYERGHTADRFVETDLWDNLRQGLLAGERLQAALRRMNQAYLDRNWRDYELTKHVSLRVHAPAQYLRLRRTGSCEFELPEWLFDLDYPGQYLRRLKYVSVSLPCVVGPYTGPNASLTLLASSTRVDPALIRPPHGCCDEREGRCACDEPGYLPQPDEPRIVRDYLPLEAIATSSGRDDTGLFQLNFGDDRYLPFEFAGAVSRWRLELPPENNFFDLSTLTDVVLHVNYTAREGGEALRRAAARDAAPHLPGDGLRMLDIRNEQPEALRRSGPDGRWELGLRLSREMFPYLPGRPDLSVDGVRVLFAAPSARPGRHHLLRLEHGGDPDGGRRRGTDVPCVASADWPGCFQAELPLRAAGERGGHVRPGHPADLGVLAFPEGLDVGEVFLLCRYQGQPGRAEDWR